MEQFDNFFTEEEFNEICKQKESFEADKKGYVSSFKYFYQKTTEKNKTIEDIYNNLKHSKLTSGMDNLLKFFREKNEEMIIISTNLIFAIKAILENHKFLDYFNEIIAYQSNVKNNLISPIDIEIVDCDLCHPNLCKINELKKYFERNHKNKKDYQRCIFICDGNNDYCIARNLEKNDIICIRKNYKLYKKLYKDNYIKNIKCNIFVWENGNDIVDYLKNLE